MIFHSFVSTLIIRPILYLTYFHLINSYSYRLHFVLLRIQTSYVPVEPKRKSPQDASIEAGLKTPAVDTAVITGPDFQREEETGTPKKAHLGKKGSQLRRSRIIITVKRTDDFKQWLEDNPYHTVGHNDDVED